MASQGSDSTASTEASSHTSAHTSGYASDDDDVFGDFGAAPIAAVPAATGDIHSPAVAGNVSTSPAISAATPVGASGVSRVAADDDDDDGFGDFDTAPTASAVSTPAAVAGSAVEPAAAVGTDDDFGDFGEASASPNQPPATAANPSAAVAAQPAVQASADDADDDFGDFDDATAAPVQSTAVTAAAVAAAPAPAQQQTAAPAVQEGPDILQLSGPEFLSAVLDAWRVLGAPEGYKAAAAQQPAPDSSHQRSPVTVTLPWAFQSGKPPSPNSIRAYQGVPLRVLQPAHSDKVLAEGLVKGGMVDVPVEVSSSWDLDWRGSASEARLIDGLGLRQAVERALAQLDKDAAGKAVQQQQHQQQQGVPGVR